MRDLIIIGSGPAGLAAAREAQEIGLDFVVLERGIIAETVHQYPIGKQLFSTPEELELARGALVCRGPKPTREELLTHYTRFAIDREFDIRTGEPALSIERRPDGFLVTTPVGTYESSAVLVATGINGFRKHLSVPGESPDRVHYRFVEAYPYAGRRVVVAGSGNSAAETTLFFEEVGAHATLVMRRPGFGADPATGKPEIKWWVREPLERLVAEGRIAVHCSSVIVEVTESGVVVEAVDGTRTEVACDAVFALLGTAPDLRILESAGVRIDSDGVPVYDPDTFETNVPGLFVTGHITHERHIKGALKVAPHVMKQIAKSISLERPAV